MPGKSPHSLGSTRRNFLRKSLGTLALAPLAGVLATQAEEPPAAKPSPGTLRDVLILGAGMSGLRAARQIDPEAKPEAEPGLRQEIRT